MRRVCRTGAGSAHKTPCPKGKKFFLSTDRLAVRAKCLAESVTQGKNFFTRPSPLGGSGSVGRDGVLCAEPAPADTLGAQNPRSKGKKFFLVDRSARGARKMPDRVGHTGQNFFQATKSLWWVRVGGSRWGFVRRARAGRHSRRVKPQVHREKFFLVDRPAREARKMPDRVGHTGEKFFRAPKSPWWVRPNGPRWGLCAEPAPADTLGAQNPRSIGKKFFLVDRSARGARKMPDRVGHTGQKFFHATKSLWWVRVEGPRWGFTRRARAGPTPSAHKPQVHREKNFFGRLPSSRCALPPRPALGAHGKKISGG